MNEVEKLTRAIASSLTLTTLDAVIADLDNVPGIGPGQEPICGLLRSFCMRMVRQRSVLAAQLDD